jgi:hypothetical protein
MVDISEKAKAILNDPRLFTKRDDWIASLQNLFDGGLRDTVMAMSGCYAQIKSADMKKDSEAWVAEELENMAENAEKLDNDITFMSLYIEAGYYGVHFVDNLFGAEVFWNEDSKQWFTRHLVREPGALETPDIDKAWIVLKRVALEFVRQGVAFPFFGIPSIASALNVGINLFGEVREDQIIYLSNTLKSSLVSINSFRVYSNVPGMSCFLRSTTRNKPCLSSCALYFSIITMVSCPPLFCQYFFCKLVQVAEKPIFRLYPPCRRPNLILPLSLFIAIFPLLSLSGVFSLYTDIPCSPNILSHISSPHSGQALLPLYTSTPSH